MGTVELLKNLSLLLFALAGVFAAATIFLFLKLNIRGAVRILSGSGMKKDIEAYRAQRISAGKTRNTAKGTNRRKETRTEILEEGTLFLNDETDHQH